MGIPASMIASVPIDGSQVVWSLFCVIILHLTVSKYFSEECVRSLAECCLVSNLFLFENKERDFVIVIFCGELLQVRLRTCCQIVCR